MLKTLCFFVIMLFNFALKAQYLHKSHVYNSFPQLNLGDSTLKKHSPKRAAIYSAVVPGLGQIYNKKYWKLPLVYAGIGVSAGFLIFNQSELNKTKFDLNALTDNDPNTLPVIISGQPTPTKEQVIGDYEFYRQNRDYSIMALSIFYVLNIVDATVDAHFFNFNINQDLKGNVKPFMNVNGARGINLSLKF